MASSILVIAVIAALAWMLGWMPADRSWMNTTGWNRVPQILRPVVSSRPLPGGPEIHWLGHAGFLVSWHGSTLLLDPNTEDHCTVARREMELPAPISQAGPVDAALISHAHFDHMNLQTLGRASRLDRIILPAGSEDYFKKEQWPNVTFIPLDCHGSTRVGELEIIAVPAAHNGNRFHPWRSSKRAVGYIIRDGRDTLYVAGDTSAANDFRDLRDRYHPNLAILPIGSFSPRFPLKIHHLSPEEAVAAARTLGVAVVMPCHFGTFRLTFDRVDTALPRFARSAQLSGQPWVMPALWRGSHGP